MNAISKHRTSLFLAGAVFSLLGGGMAGKAKDSSQPPGLDREANSFVREGVEVKFTIEPLAAATEQLAKLREGEDATVRFALSGATGEPLERLRPAAWISLRRGEDAADANACQEKIRSFLQGGLAARPEADLNAYYLLTLNQEPNLSVIDPLLGHGTSKLLTLVPLKSPGEDWALSRDGKRVFVALPSDRQVAVVDTASWKVATYLDAGAAPTRLALQPDGKYLWAGDETPGDESGIVVIDAEALKIVARIPTGAGHHEIAFTGDSRYALVTNRQEGGLSIIDAEKLMKVKEIDIGGRPVSLAYSTLSRAFYVADEAGSILVVDGRRHEIAARIAAKPGMGVIRFSHDGRWGFAVNGRENLVYILDASNHRILDAVDAGAGADQVAFTHRYVYIRAAGSEYVSMIQLDALGKSGKVPLFRFPAGKIPAEESYRVIGADAIAPTPEGHAVVVANPADKTLYYYMEGMAAPMGNFQNYGRKPKAVQVVDKSLRETAPGVYSTSVRLPQSGVYDVAFLLDSPRLHHCFTAKVEPNPSLEKARPVQVEFLAQEKKSRVGETIRLRFKLTDPATRRPKAGLKDVRVLAFLAPGTWQKRDLASSLDEGLYEATFIPPREGVYYLFVESASLGMRYHQLPHLILPVREEEAAEKEPEVRQEKER